MNAQHKDKVVSEVSVQRRCIYCGNIAEVVWVHGHGQCSYCGVNVEECCRGEQCNRIAT